MSLGKEQSRPTEQTMWKLDGSIQGQEPTLLCYNKPLCSCILQVKHLSQLKKKRAKAYELNTVSISNAGQILIPPTSPMSTV